VIGLITANLLKNEGKTHLLYKVKTQT